MVSLIQKNRTELLCPVYIGTSGIVLPYNKDKFPPHYESASRLRYYSSVINSLEVNSSFYKTPQPKTLVKWKNDVLDDFKFTIKLSRDITHARNLDFDSDILHRFMNSINHLEDKKGALLIQFPASITSKYLNNVEKILQQIAMLQAEPRWDIAVEVRHSSWYNNDTYEMLTEHHASMVFHDMPGSKTPTDQTANDIIYFRFHGPVGDYRGSYDEIDLRNYSKQIFDAYTQGKRVYVYFNNTMGNAYENSTSLAASFESLKNRLSIDNFVAQ